MSEWRGSESDQTNASSAGLIAGSTYHLKNIAVWGFGSDVELEEFPDERFYLLAI